MAGRAMAAPGGRSHNRGMASRRDTAQPAASDTWIALGWASVAVLVVVAAQLLALPPNRPVAFEVGERGEFWRPEWLVAATLACAPLRWCAQRCWWLGAALFVLVSAQLVFTAASGVEVLTAAGLANSVDVGWYAVAGGQVLACLVAVVGGAARNLSHRRWVRSMVASLPELADLAHEDLNEGLSAAG